VQHLDFLTQHEKDVYKTAFELDQRWIIEHAADRTPYICQSQSINVFVPANVDKRDLHQIHYQAWKKGVKSLYYCRSLSIQRADNVSEKAIRPDEFTGIPPYGVPVNDTGLVPLAAASSTNYEECLACQ
jgi:ribonucleoside-diphosphate reductase alpha chain